MTQQDDEYEIELDRADNQRLVALGKVRRLEKENATLRAENERLTAGIAELGAWLNEWMAKQTDVNSNFPSQYAEGLFDAYENVQKRLRELGLVADAPVGKGEGE